jgi:hypothetical protein
MKKIIFSITICGLLFAVNSCKKTDPSTTNPLADVTSMGVGAYVVLDSTISSSMNAAAISSATVGVIVHQYAGSDPIDHIDVFVTPSASYDTTKWKKVKTVAYSGTTTITVTGAEMATALGVAPGTIAPGNYYTFYNRMYTKSGQRYDVNNTGTNSGSGLLGGSNYKACFSFVANVVCPFVAPMAGNYKVVYDDDWQDWADGSIVPVTDGPGTNQLNISEVWPNPRFGKVINPLYIVVDPATGVASVPSGISWGDYGYICSTMSGSSGNVFSCTGLVSMKIHVNAGIYGDQGLMKLVLQKQ